MSNEETNDNAPEISPPSNNSELNDELNFDGFNIGQQFADDLAALSESLQKIQQSQVAPIANALQSYQAIQRSQVAELAKSLQSTQSLQQRQIANIIQPLNTFQEIQRTQTFRIAEQLQELSQIQAEIVLVDFPDEVFTTAVAASTVSAQAGTNPSSPTAASSTPTPNTSIDTESSTISPSTGNVPAWSPYLEAAVTLGVYLSYRIEGLDQSQREAAAILFAGSIVFGAASHLSVSETPLVAGSATATLMELALRLRSGEDQE